MKYVPFEWNKDFDLFPLREHTVLLCLSGSRAYGTYNENSDWDFKGICLPPKEFRDSLVKNFEQTIWKSEELSGRESEITKKKEELYECTIFSLKKFMIKAIECNPNIIELLFSNNEELVLYQDNKISKLLFDSVDLFLSERALYSFTGYAIGQLKRIETHRKYLSKPIKFPTREEFGLIESNKSLNESQLQACFNFISKRLDTIAPYIENASNEDKEKFYYSVSAIVSLILNEKNFKYDINLNNWVKTQNEISNLLSNKLGFDTPFLEYIKKEKSYFNAMREYKQYEDWRLNRNQERAVMEAAYGFDGKHGLHLIRLLLMGEELLTKGTLQVKRPEAEFLKEIRNGLWTYDQLIQYAKEKEEHLYSLVKNNKTALPKKPDINKIEDLYQEIISIK